VRPPSPPESGAEEAVKLADQGHFAEASRCCEALLRQHGPSAQVFHVLGLVRDASGNAEDAAIYYRKALYLDPGHQDALVHLALLMEKQGLKSEAQTLWNRVRRLAAKGAMR
jgi:chemotaxis protein methyltransferase WspC